MISYKAKLISAAAVLIVVTTSNATTLKWKESENADGYIIHFNDSSKNVGKVDSYPMAKLPLEKDVEYTMGVAAYNKEGESGLSNIIKFTLLDEAPGTPEIWLEE